MKAVSLIQYVAGIVSALIFAVAALSGTIGNDTTYTNQAGWNGPESYALIHPDHLYVAGPNETVDSIYIYMQRWSGEDHLTYVGVYDLSNGLPDRRIGRIQLETDGAQPQWIGADVDWPLAAGDTFCVAFETLSGALIGFPYSSLANGLSNDAGSILPDPWTHDGYSSYSIGCYAVTTTTGSTEEKRTARRSKVIHGDIK